MSGRLCCKQCLQRQDDGERCRQCGEDALVDLEMMDGEQRDEFFDQLQRRAAGRRRRFVFFMEALVIALCAGILFVGLTIAEGLGGGVLNWGVKLIAVALLAAGFWSSPRVYDRHLRGRASELLSTHKTGL